MCNGVKMDKEWKIIWPFNRMNYISTKMEDENNQVKQRNLGKGMYSPFVQGKTGCAYRSSWELYIGPCAIT